MLARRIMQDGLGHGRCFVKQRGVGDRQANEVLDHGLEVQQCLQAALRDFRLVRGVSGVPGRGLKDVAADHRRRDGVVVALADHLDGGLVLGGELAQLGQDLDFAQRVLQGEGDVLADVVRNGSVDQRVNGVVANGLEHGLDVGLAAGADMPIDEGGGGRTNRHEGTPDTWAAFGYATAARVPPRSVLDLRVSACCPHNESLAPSVSTASHVNGVECLLLSRVASPRRCVGLRDSWGGFAPTAPASRACRTLPPQIKGMFSCLWAPRWARHKA